MAIERYEKNPILTYRDIPPITYAWNDVSSVFNPAAILYDNKIILLLRIQNRGRETSFAVAESQDGKLFQVRPKQFEILGIPKLNSPIYHIYDARLTLLEGKIYMTIAMDLDNVTLSALCEVHPNFDFAKFLCFLTDLDSRNAVLFPEKINGHYYALIRPNNVAGAIVTTGSIITLLSSTDLNHWQNVGEVMQGRLRYWDEWIGAGPPPIKTKYGWLCIYHGVATHFGAGNIYQMGVAMLDRTHPNKVIGRSRYNCLEPREPYELMGQVPNVVFPTGIVVLNYDEEGNALPESRFLLYYGAADTCVALVRGTIQDLINACFEGAR
ncbi:MAG: hypothetical protein N2450_06450 [bacterium]|nr:hypothetical protein [bacterium]